jgi:hypothetical protein
MQCAQGYLDLCASTLTALLVRVARNVGSHNDRAGRPTNRSARYPYQMAVLP